MKPTRYETHDLALAAFLIASESTRLTDIASNGDGRKRFIFDPPPDKETLIRFYSGESQVSARRFAEALSSLKGSGYTMREFQ